LIRFCQTDTRGGLGTKVKPIGRCRIEGKHREVWAAKADMALGSNAEQLRQFHLSTATGYTGLDRKTGQHGTSVAGHSAVRDSVVQSSAYVLEPNLGSPFAEAEPTGSRRGVGVKDDLSRGGNLLKAGYTWVWTPT